MTRQLIDGELFTSVRRRLIIETIVRQGGTADAAALLPVVLGDPNANSDLLDVIAVHGDASMAQPILALVDDGLDDETLGSTLWTIGRLGHEPAERLLWTKVESGHYVMREACLGLFHLPCRSIRDDIAAALRRHENTPLFPEFLPLLAIKTGDPSWADRMVEWGRTASTDCNGGLVAGIAAYGDRERFARVLWDPWWETHGSGTGTPRWAYAGCRLLGLSAADLLAQARERLADNPTATLATFAQVLWLMANRVTIGIAAVDEPTESATDLLDAMFGPSDRALTLASAVLDRDSHVWETLYEARAALTWRARAELADTS